MTAVFLLTRVRIAEVGPALFGKLVGGGQVRVSVSADQSALSLECIPASQPEVTA